MKAKSELTWTEIEPSELPVECQVLYAEYKAAYKAMKAAREAFEAQGRASIPAAEGMEIKFGYNFGKLSIAEAPKAAEKPKPKVGLAAFLAARVNAGLNV